MPKQTPYVESSQPGLHRGVGVFTAACVVIANVIGVGIFTTPGFLARDLGSPFAVLAIWVLGAILALAGALSYSELGAAFPEAGGEYVYLREAYGPLWGYLCVWTSFLAGFAPPFAPACIGFAACFPPFVPALAPDQLILSGQAGPWKVSLGGGQIL